MAATPKDTPMDGPADVLIPALPHPDSSKPALSVPDRLEAWLSEIWEAGKTETDLIWKFILAFGSLQIVLIPILVLTGLIAHGAYVDKFGMASGSMEFSVTNLLYWGWLAWFAQLGSAFKLFLIVSMMLILVPIMMKSAKEIHWLLRLARIPLAVFALLLVVASAVELGSSQGEKLAKATVEKADFSVRFVIPKTLEPNFDPVFLACNQLKGDLRKVWATKEAVVVYSVTQRRPFEVSLKDIQNVVAEPIENVKQAHKL